MSNVMDSRGSYHEENPRMVLVLAAWNTVFVYFVVRSRRRIYQFK